MLKLAKVLGATTCLTCWRIVCISNFREAHHKLLVNCNFIITNVGKLKKPLVYAPNEIVKLLLILVSQ